MRMTNTYHDEMTYMPDMDTADKTTVNPLTLIDQRALIRLHPAELVLLCGSRHCIVFS